jgi:hypothetical protein
MRWTLLHHRHPLLGTGRCCPSTRLPLSSPGSAPTTSSPALASCATRGSKRPRYRRVARRGHQQHRAQLHTKFNDLCAMAKSAVDRSEGQLREFAGKYFITDELMQYIVERCVCFLSSLACSSKILLIRYHFVSKGFHIMHAIDVC